MKKVLLWLVLSAVTVPALQAYDIKYNGLCYDVVGEDVTQNVVYVEVVGPEEDHEEFLTSQIYYSWTDASGVNYKLRSVGKDAFRGAGLYNLAYVGIPTDTVVFKSGCFADNVFNSFQFPLAVDYFGQKTSTFIFEEGWIANSKGIGTVYYQDWNEDGTGLVEKRYITLRACHELKPGSFYGADLDSINLNGAVLWGGAFEKRIEGVHYKSESQIIAFNGEKVFPGLRNLTIDRTVDTISGLDVLADFGSGVEIATDAIYPAAAPEVSSGCLSGAKLKVPFFAEKYFRASAPWNEATIEPVYADYYTDEETKVVYRKDSREAYGIVYGGDASGDVVFPAILPGYDMEVASYIRYKAFYDNQNITSLTVDGALTAEDLAFGNCKNLKRIKANQFYSSWSTFEGCAVEEVEVAIGMNAYFYGNTVKKVILGENCEIGNCFFRDALAEDAVIYSHAVNPPAVLPPDEELYATVKVLVPTGCAEAYRSHEVWGKFKNIEETDYASANLSTTGRGLRLITSGNTVMAEGVDGRQLTIYDLSGRKVWETAEYAGQEIVLNSGTYIAQGAAQTEKFVLR